MFAFLSSSLWAIIFVSAKSSFKTFKRKEILQTKIFSLETIFQSQPQARGDGGLGSGERMIFKQTYTLSLFTMF